MYRFYFNDTGAVNIVAGEHHAYVCIAVDVAFSMAREPGSFGAPGPYL